jgi:hypothetical protein
MLRPHPKAKHPRIVNSTLPKKPARPTPLQRIMELEALARKQEIMIEQLTVKVFNLEKETEIWE